jgi:hypothetical protein
MENLALGVFARNTLKKQEDKNKTLGNSRHLPCFCESGKGMVKSVSKTETKGQESRK